MNRPRFRRDADRYELACFALIVICFLFMVLVWLRPDF